MTASVPIPRTPVSAREAPFLSASLALRAHLWQPGLKSHPLACILFASLHTSFLSFCLPISFRSFCLHFRDDIVAESFPLLLF